MHFHLLLLLFLSALAISRPTGPSSLVSYEESTDLVARFLEGYPHLYDKRAGGSSKGKLKHWFGLDKDKKHKDKNDKNKKKDEDDPNDGKKGESSKGSTNPPIISHVPLTIEEIGTGLRQIDYVLKRAKIPYAVIGGIALKAHGMTERETADFDIIVDNGRVKDAARELSLQGLGIGILAQSGADQVWYTYEGKSHNIDIMEPSRIGGLNPESSDTTSHFGGEILKQSELLNLKCESWMKRDASKETKTKQDGKDILFLLNNMTRNKISGSPESVPNAKGAFLNAWLQEEPQTKAIWKAWGF